MPDFSNNQAAYICGVLVIAFMLMQSFTIIEPGYRGISVTLGTIDPNYRSEGLTFKVPFIETITKVPIKQITMSGEATCFSKDLQTVNVSFKALYRIPQDKIVTLFQQYQGDPYTTLVEPRIQDAIKQVAALYRAEDLVKEREQVRTRTLEIVRKELSEETKTPLVNLVDLPISGIDLSDELEKAIEMKQIKEQEALAKNYELDKAKKQAEIVQVEAEAEAKAVHIKGQALKASPEVIELEIAKKWNGTPPTTVVVGKGGGNVLLPLK